MEQYFRILFSHLPSATALATPFYRFVDKHADNECHYQHGFDRVFHDVGGWTVASDN